MNTRVTKAYDNNVISFSKLMSYLYCPFRYYQEYVKKEFYPLNANMLFGKNIHEIIEKLIFAESVEEVRSILNDYGIFDDDSLLKAFAFSEFMHNRKIAELPEQAFWIKLNEKYLFEFHPDFMFFSDSGDLFIIDVKTSPEIMTETEIEKNIQLNLYAFAYIKYLEQNLDLLKNDKLIDLKKKILDIGNVYIGIWYWQHGYVKYAKYKHNDYTEILIKLVDRMNETKIENFYKQENKYCVSCPHIRKCFNPDEKEIKEIKEYYVLEGLLKKIEKQLELARLELENVCINTKTNEIKSEDGKVSYIIKQNVKKKLINEKIIKIIEEKFKIEIPEILKKYIKFNKRDLKELGIEINDDLEEIQSNNYIINYIYNLDVDDFKIKTKTKKQKSKKKKGGEENGQLF